jgi:GT2 family glycosyltransferase
VQVSIIGRVREIWYEEAHAPLYLVALPGALDAPAGSGAGWREQVIRAGIRRRAVALPAGTRLTHHLQIPPRAELHVWLALGDGATGAALRVRFAAADGQRAEWRCTIDAHVHGWTLWRLPMGALAAAEGDLELATEQVSGAATGAVLWGNPVLLSRRQPEEVLALARAFLALFGPRAALRKAWELATRPTFDQADDYDSWRRHRAAAAVPDAPVGPSFSVLLRGGGDAAARSLASLRRQSWPRWQVCVAASAGPADARDAARAVDADGDSWSELLAAASGDFIVTLEAGDLLAPHALASVAAAVAAHPQVDLVYTDEDRLDAAGRHAQPFFKPDWSPEYFLASGYTGRLSAWRRAAVVAAGGFDVQRGDAQEFDLTLRLLERGARVHHVDDVLYHRAAAAALGNGADAQAAQALDAYLARRELPGHAEPHSQPGLLRLRYGLRGRPLVSIVIPTGGRERLVGERRLDLLVNCVTSIVRRSTYADFEILCLDDCNLRPETRAGLAALDDARVRIESYRLPLNIAAKMNAATAMTHGEQLIFLNDDIEVITPDWIEAMLEFSQQPEIGAVGAKLLFPSGVIQHAGMAVADRVPIILSRWAPRDSTGYFGNLAVPCNYSSLIGACLMTRRERFEAVGGFDERMPFLWHDLDYCFQVRARGARVVFTPYAELYHFETASRPAAFRAVETLVMARKWGDALQRDPYYSRHFRQDRADFRVGG